VRKRRRLLFGLLALLALTWATILWLWPAPVGPRTSLRTLARIAPGMSQDEVTAELGPPVADVTDRPPTDVPPAASVGRPLLYTGDRATATVEFGLDGRMVRCHPFIRTVNLEERIRLRLNTW
jgi:hypothetical protein